MKFCMYNVILYKGNPYPIFVDADVSSVENLLPEEQFMKANNNLAFIVTDKLYDIVIKQQKQFLAEAGLGLTVKLSDNRIHTTITGTTFKDITPAW